MGRKYNEKQRIKYTVGLHKIHSLQRKSGLYENYTLFACGSPNITYKQLCVCGKQATTMHSSNGAVALVLRPSALDEDVMKEASATAAAAAAAAPAGGE
ncbi:Protein of unknown function [Gryllus bimaculatus]|nr:Protein of unknown function [Gryllus bimaculatus]